MIEKEGLFVLELPIEDGLQKTVDFSTPGAEHKLIIVGHSEFKLCLVNRDTSFEKTIRWEWTMITPPHHSFISVMSFVVDVVGSHKSAFFSCPFLIASTHLYVDEYEQKVQDERLQSNMPIFKSLLRAGHAKHKSTFRILPLKKQALIDVWRPQEDQCPRK